jgi:hypothetical protein
MSDERFNGQITDPVAQLPHNPYSASLDNQQWIWVKAKAQIKNGELDKLFISDLAARSVLAPA